MPPKKLFMKISPFGAELFHADRQKDGRTGGRDEDKSGFLKFCERVSKPKRKRVKNCDFFENNTFHFTLQILIDNSLSPWDF
jgi:hypothetical protein